jgi:hypothetical protein
MMSSPNQQIIDAMTMADLRAEVASLKESLANAVNADWHNEKVESLTQQLAAANGRVEMLRKSLYLISVVEQWCGGNLRPQDMVDIAIREARAALSNLNEDSVG